MVEGQSTMSYRSAVVVLSVEFYASLRFVCDAEEGFLGEKAAAQASFAAAWRGITNASATAFLLTLGARRPMALRC